MALTEWQAVGRLGSRPGKATTLVLGFAAQHAASSKEVAPSRIHGFPGTAPLFVPQYKSICPALKNLHFYSGKLFIRSFGRLPSAMLERLLLVQF